MTVISILLLTLCGFSFAFIAFKYFLGERSSEQDYHFTRALIGFGKALLGVFILAWLFFQNKENRLFASSILLSACFVYAGYCFKTSRSMQENVASQSVFSTNELVKLNDNYARLKSYILNSGDGESLQFEDTGNTNLDAVFNLAKNFYSSYVREYNQANDKIKSLHETYITVDAVLTNKELIGLEIQKRKLAQNIIESFSSNAIPMCDTFLSNVVSLKLSDDYKKSIVEALRQAPLQYGHMFSVWSNIQKTEGKYYEFLHSNFDDYTLQDDALVFKSDANIKLCQALGQSVLDARGEAHQIQKAAITNFDNSVSKLK
jgi:hypothetical protein